MDREERRERRLIEWQTKTTCLFIAQMAGVWMDGKGNPLVDGALELSLFPDERDRAMDRMRGERTGYVRTAQDVQGAEAAYRREKAAEEAYQKENAPPAPPPVMITDETTGEEREAIPGIDPTPDWPDPTRPPDAVYNEPQPGSFEGFASTIGRAVPAPRGPEPT